MEIKKVDATTFDEFVLRNDKAHFMQTSSWANVASSRNYRTHLLGFYKKDVLVACALLLEKDITIYKTFFCPRGPILDYKDKELLKEVLYSLKDYSKKNRGLYVKIDPDLPIHLLDDNANPTIDYKDNIELIDYLKNLGLKHRGFTIKFNESSNPRFTFRVNVDKNEDELLDSFHKTTKNILRKNNPYNINIYKGDISDVENFYKTIKETAKRKKMYLEPKEFFANFYSLLNKDNRSDIFVAKISINDLKETYRKNFEELDKEYANLSNYSLKKQESLILDLNDRKAKLEKELSQVNQINDEEIILSSIITAKFKDKVWIIHGGNSDKLSFLNANYELYYAVMKDAHKQGYKYVDLFGSEGKVDKTSSEYGIYLFKLRFSGEFTEFIGEFDIITKPFMNFFISKALHIRRRLLIKKQTNSK